MGHLFTPHKLILNEIALLRKHLLNALFPQTTITHHNAELIHDFLDDNDQPSVILMNPPFSSSPNIQTTRLDSFPRHLKSALDHLQPQGRLVTIGPEAISPYHPNWKPFFSNLQSETTIQTSLVIDKHLYSQHGVTITTRLTVIDKCPARDPNTFPQPHPAATSWRDLQNSLDLPPRLPLIPKQDQSLLDLIAHPKSTPSLKKTKTRPFLFIEEKPKTHWDNPQPLAYRLADQKTSISDTPHPNSDEDTGCYRHYTTERIIIDGAPNHPAPLMQSIAMASVLPPVPDYHPLLPQTIMENGLLSQAQCESVIYAGQAHNEQIPGRFRIGTSWEQATLINENNTPDEEPPFSPEETAHKQPPSSFTSSLRRGWFLGDGTGTGKGRQAAGIVLDNWLRGCQRALWLSKSDKLIEDARRDWTALGGQKHDIHPVSSWRPQQDIPLTSGILFTTYATLRREDRLKQIINWLAGEKTLTARLTFEGVLLFDEAHAMANAAGGKTAGRQRAMKPSAQGQAGLKLQNALPQARVVYISATGATNVNNLAYASRLGLWGSQDMPFMRREDFITAMEKGGVAAMEAVARDLKTLGLYTARCLSYAGVETAILEHPLTSAQRDIYDHYAHAFKIIHHNIQEALKDTSIANERKTLNPQAKSVALSAFEGAKQRFFGHLLTSMKCPSLIKAIEEDLTDGRAPIIQLTSTGEAIQERRLAEIPPGEWNDLSVDLTPREYVLSYLERAFPVHLFEPYENEEGHIQSRPVLDDKGETMICKKALARRNHLIEKLASLPPIPCALDQIIRHFGHQRVAEITGRSRRIILEEDRLKVQKRPPSASLAEAQAFMNNDKDILVFSEAGGTGRSYHADCTSLNHKRRVHYLLEPGWRADIAIQGLGRSHRTHQASAPLFRPVCTDVKGERRFISTIARRLDTLGAITRGERRSQGQGLFRAEDNLESTYAKAALRQLYLALHQGDIENWSLKTFEDTTGLQLTYQNTLKDNLPPMSQFLNRVLALPIIQQNQLFTELETRIATKIEQAIEGGTFDIGIETLKANSFTLKERLTIFTHERTRAQTRLLTITKRNAIKPLSAEEALAQSKNYGSQPQLLINQRSHRASISVPAPGLIDDQGKVIDRSRLLRPAENTFLTGMELMRSHWEPASRSEWQTLWEAEIASLPSHKEDQIYLVTGLLLPIWDRCPSETATIRRLTTDDGQAFLGRLLNEEQTAQLKQQCGLSQNIDTQSPEELAERILKENRQFKLAGDLRLRRRKIMGQNRIEVEGSIETGINQTTLNLLRDKGCMIEIIQFKPRVFVPEPSSDHPVLARILKHWPVIETSP